MSISFLRIVFLIILIISLTTLIYSFSNHPSIISFIHTLRNSQTYVIKNNSYLAFYDVPIPLVNKSTPLDEAEKSYYRFVTKLEVNCSDSIRLGNKGDGGWNVCLAPWFNLSKPCLVYSFGINNDFSFDDEMVDNFSCMVRAFDPSMIDTVDHVRKEMIHFYKIGLTGFNSDNYKAVVKGKEQVWKLRTLSALLQQFNETNKQIDYLKMDIESSEWSTFETAFKSTSDANPLRNVKQLGFEVHRSSNYEMYFKLFRQLRQFGFYKWYAHSNKFCNTCHELVFINLNFMLP